MYVFPDQPEFEHLANVARGKGVECSVDVMLFSSCWNDGEGVSAYVRYTDEAGIRAGKRFSEVSEFREWLEAA